MDNRWLNFESIANARDLGGLKTLEGHTITSGLLLRSANLANASRGDMETLQREYRLSKIIDLKTSAEREERPDASIPGVAVRHIPVFSEQLAGISHEKGTDASQLQKLIPKLDGLYRLMVTNESCRRSLGLAAACVMEHDFTGGNVLWHCTEGKDRCGLLTVILLSALRVDRQQIREDYLLTNEVNRPKAEMYYKQVLAAGRPTNEAEMVRDVFLARESYLDAAFSAIDEHYPDMVSFLRDGLYIPEGAIEKFRISVLH